MRAMRACARLAPASACGLAALLCGGPPAEPHGELLPRDVYSEVLAGFRAAASAAVARDAWRVRDAEALAPEEAARLASGGV